jgi:molybdate transport system regulatory protein
MPRIKLSVVFESGARIGPGKAALLESIRDSGSISAAARDMGMPYKRAWMLLDSMNRAFNQPVVEAVTGGAHGGGARLTPFGADVLGRYRRMLAAAETASTEDLAALARAALPDAGPKI